MSASTDPAVPDCNSASSFTPWSIETYKRDGVEAACLCLQDKVGANVNIALWACWCADKYDAIEQLAFRKAIDLTDRWNREVTTALRCARRAVKAAGGRSDLYEDIKAAELNAEFAEQNFLAELTETALIGAPTKNINASRRRAAQNLTAYASLIGAQHKPDFSTQLLETLIDCIFDAADETMTEPNK